MTGNRFVQLAVGCILALLAVLAFAALSVSHPVRSATFNGWTTSQSSENAFATAVSSQLNGASLESADRMLRRWRFRNSCSQMRPCEPGQRDYSYDVPIYMWPIVDRDHWAVRLHVVDDEVIGTQTWVYDGAGVW